LGFVGDELAKVGGRAGKNRAAQAGTLLSLSIICGGVFLGAPTPYHWPASKPGRNSPIVWMPRSVSERVALATSGRSVPVLMYSGPGCGFLDHAPELKSLGIDCFLDRRAREVVGRSFVRPDRAGGGPGTMVLPAFGVIRSTAPHVCCAP